MQIIVGLIVCTTPAIVWRRRFMLASKVRFILLACQSILIKIRLADIVSRIAQQRAAELCSVAAALLAIVALVAAVIRVGNGQEATAVT